LRKSWLTLLITGLLIVSVALVGTISCSNDEEVATSFKALSIDGTAATVENAKDGTYPIVRPLYLLTDGDPASIAKDFIDYCLSEAGQDVAEDEGYISVGDGAAMTKTGLTGTISAAGSTTVQPLAEAIADAFNVDNPGVTVSYNGTGSSAGVTAAGTGTADIGGASREIKSSEETDYPNLKTHLLCRDGIAIVANIDDSVSGLTAEQVMEIFAGDITNWSEVGGLDESINVIAREEGSGTRAAFEDMVMEDELITSSATLLQSNGAVKTKVQNTPYSIGFLSFGYL
jgi:ABC-type phosphate transport system substrate-binding protein